MISDALKTIAARLCLTEETQLDGRMLLAQAEAVALLESRLAEYTEKAEAVVQALNDPLNAIQDLVTTLQTLTPKPVLPIDGPSRDYPCA